MAHTSSVNCLRIGRKSSRVLVTGGEDHKVNLWAIGKPNALLVSSISWLVFPCSRSCFCFMEFVFVVSESELSLRHVQFT